MSCFSTLYRKAKKSSRTIKKIIENIFENVLDDFFNRSVNFSRQQLFYVTLENDLRPYIIDMELYTDIYYIKRVQSGDTASFACLLDRYSRPVYSLVYRIVNSREDAEELSQDIFLKVFKNLSGFKGDSSFSTWLYRIAYNTAVSFVRKKKQEFLAIEESLLDNVTEADLEEMYGREDAEERYRNLEHALELLHPEEKGIILLFYMRDKTIEEIAGISGLSVVNVKTKLHRIRKKLYVILTKMKEE